MRWRSSISVLMIGLLSAAGLHAAQADHIVANGAWIRLLPAGLPAAGYVALQNTGPSAATLVTAHSATYASVMLHRSSTENGGMSTMSAMENLVIPAQGKVALAPAGYHLMLEQSGHPLKPGDGVEITLDFADGSHLPVRFLVQPANATGPN
jgi:periplasmic copper chaperone A